jgi:two-component system, cell cycle sensor histidine kinase and response regulator CckA
MPSLESDSAFRTMFDGNPLPMWVFDDETLRILAVNDAAVSKYGWPRDEFLLMTIEDMRTPEGVEKLREYRRKVGGAKTPGLNQTVRWSHRTKSGGLLDVESTWFEIPFKGRRCVLVTTMDCTEQRQADQRAREQAAMLDLASDAIVVHDLEHRVVYWNHGAERLYGWNATEVCGAKVMEFFGSDPQISDTVLADVQRRGEWNGELKHRKKDGREIYVNSRQNLVRDEAGNPRSVLVINTDTTEAHTREQQFFRAQRLEAIGTLASGIAHDLNNILSPILMATGLLRREAAESPSVLKMLKIIENSADRGAGIVKQVLTFARGAEGERVALQPKHLLSELSKIMAQTFPKNVEIQAQIPTNLWMISGDATQLHQVLLNLCVNARDAVLSVPTRAHGEEPPRVLTLDAENMEVDEHFAKTNPGAQLGPHVVMRVADTGTGMTPEVMEKIFDPFFTTKDPGKGTGLGLATVIGIVKSHGGFLRVQSELGKGTTFKVFIPALPDAISSETPKAETVPIPTGKNELILVVDDEAPIRDALVQTLEANGYRCYTAEDGTDALALYFQRRDEIHLVMTDISMAQMDGVRLTRSLRKLNPGVRVIVSSGHIQKENQEELQALGVKVFLEKPYNADKLLRAIRKVLDTKVGS